MKPDKPSSRERIDHVLKAIHSIQTYSQSHSLESFLQDEKSIDACLYQYTIIGEAIANIDSDILKKYDYPWYKVKSFRNFILHEYHAIEMRVIWDTTTEILPGLKEMILKILAMEF
jgi:uncharacterized protein with HEPN domain